jgi:hypothetical protein
MAFRTDFIQCIITNKDGNKSVRYVNKNHIQQIYQENNIIYIELTGYDTLEIRDENIDLFMDRFIQS